MISALEPLFVFLGIGFVIKIIMDSVTRNKLISKGMVDENVKYLFKRYGGSYSLSNIKWGMVLVGIGAAIFIREFSSITDEAMLGLMFLFAGVAFLIYYPLIKAHENKEKNS